MGITDKERLDFIYKNLTWFEIDNTSYDAHGNEKQTVKTHIRYFLKGYEYRVDFFNKTNKKCIDNAIMAMRDEK